MKDYLLVNRSVSNIFPAGNPGFTRLHTTNNYILFSSTPIIKTINRKTIFILGYLLPRNTIFNQYKDCDKYSLVEKLYNKYGRSFIDHIKGIFLIIIFEGDDIQIYTDHLGLSRSFYSVTGNRIVIGSSVNYLQKAGIKLEMDTVSLTMHSLFHRVPLKYTIYKSVYKTTYGSRILVNDEGIVISKYWQPEELIQKSSDHFITEFSYFANLLRENIKNFNSFTAPSSSLITLTGGKDSRTILAALLNLGIRPLGFTYGNPRSRDAVFASRLAINAGLSHKIINPDKTSKMFEESAKAITTIGNPEINIHRTIRALAFSEMANFSDEKSAFYAGYLGGELMMGVYYDDLIFSRVLTNSWSTGELKGIEPKLGLHFHNTLASSEVELIERISEMKCLNSMLDQSLKTFFGLFEIAIPHYYQDIFLANKTWNYPYPAFIDLEFVESIFQSRFSFLNRSLKSINLLSRYDLYELNMNIQHLLFSELDIVMFGKRGSYSTREYLLGKFYWSAIKTVRYFTQFKNYPPSFSYNTEYILFIRNYLNKIKQDHSSDMKHYFMIDEALKSLDESGPLTAENQLHKYSNIVMFYLYENLISKSDR